MQDAASTPTLSIFVPCCNEEEALPAFFEETTKVLEGMDASWEAARADDAEER